VSLLFDDIILNGFNVANAFIDAYKIKPLNKTIRHGINLGAYLVLVGVIIVWRHFSWLDGAFYLLGSLASRQLFFDIPLNWRRGLKWDYVSLDRPPKAWWDQIEVRVFGYNGRLPALCYFIIWVLCVAGDLLIHRYAS